MNFNMHSIKLPPRIDNWTAITSRASVICYTLSVNEVPHYCHIFTNRTQYIHGLLIYTESLKPSYIKYEEDVSNLQLQLTVKNIKLLLKTVSRQLFLNAI